MASASGTQIHMCSTCGKTTTKKGHLCTPVRMEPAALAVCEFCGQVADDPRHVCFPKRVELKYHCDSCGRLSTTRSLLCDPKSIPKPKASPKKKAAKASAKTKARRPAKKASAKKKR